MDGLNPSFVGIVIGTGKMLDLGKGRALLKRYRDDEGGNMAMMFSLCAVAVIGCMGAAMDYSTRSNAKMKSQSIADQIALSAAIFVKTHGRQPIPAVGTEGGNTGGDGKPQSEEGYLDKSIKVYNAEELGYDFRGWVDGGAKNVTVSVTYDDVEQTATVDVKGKTLPTFMQVLGKHSLDFAASSTAEYAEHDVLNPASILMVLDNSGSMSFDDKPLVFDILAGLWGRQDGAQPRIDALISHATDFFDVMFSLVGDQKNDKKKVLRTGMLSYNSDTLNARSVAMNWSVVSTSNSLNHMVASGGTNSAPSLATAKSWMSTEDKSHENMHGEEPLKYVVFMSDGLNTTGGSSWVAEEGTGQWYGQRCSRYFKNGSCKKYDYDTVESDSLPDFGFGWEEGKWVSTADLSSVADCTAMKDDGVKIYTIGFALAEGWYDTNEYFGEERYEYITTEIRDKAYSFLTQCASEPETFLTAENADELKEAFERIGNDIAVDIVRLSN